ncbi:MAG: COX15/CtaA family protein [Polyangiaceae bacterium]|nr:COX15/CtaA family protein [Polyangiaceae bacterium]
MSAPPALALPKARRAVVIWLWLCVLALLTMIVLGGVVRLTGSGLSITVWRPIMGAIPPLSDADWDHAFSLYRQSPEFRHVNPDMTLAGFKTIFWPEYLHRLLGRTIGVLVAVPCVVFLAQGALGRRLVRRLVVLFALGGLQGLIGWLMVASGLVDLPHVSHYRLTLHLGMGFLLFGFATWLALEQTLGGFVVSDGWPGLRRGVVAFTAFAALTALSGGLVAGLRAGHAFPTFPLMAGAWVPTGLTALAPGWRNGFDNPITVMFQHRVLGVGVLVFALVLAWVCRTRRVPRHARIGFDLIVVAVLLQVTLGITTVVMHVPVAVAAAHQGNAALVLAAALYTSYALTRWPEHVDLPDGLAAPPGALPQAT